MGLFRLLYVSRATTPQNYATLTDLLRVACERNEQSGLTGLLGYADGQFFQCLEGPRAAVNQTLGRIVRDSRHTDVVLLDGRVVFSRLFPDWGMKLIDPETLSPECLRGYLAELGEGASIWTDADKLLNHLLRAAATVVGPAATPAAGVIAL